MSAQTLLDTVSLSTPPPSKCCNTPSKCCNSALAPVPCSPIPPFLSLSPLLIHPSHVPLVFSTLPSCMRFSAMRPISSLHLPPHIFQPASFLVAMSPPSPCQHRQGCQLQLPTARQKSSWRGRSGRSSESRRHCAKGRTRRGVTQSAVATAYTAAVVAIPPPGYWKRRKL